MAESNADKNIETTSSSPVEPGEIIDDLDVRVSKEETDNVKGGFLAYTFKVVAVKTASWAKDEPEKTAD